jgi:hypothetical protein
VSNICVLLSTGVLLILGPLLAIRVETGLAECSRWIGPWSLWCRKTCTDQFRSVQGKELSPELQQGQFRPSPVAWKCCTLMLSLETSLPDRFLSSWQTSVGMVPHLHAASYQEWSTAHSLHRPWHNRDSVNITLEACEILQELDDGSLCNHNCHTYHGLRVLDVRRRQSQCPRCDVGWN